MSSFHFFRVSSALGVCAVVTLLVLASDQYTHPAADELASDSTVGALQTMLRKQASARARKNVRCKVFSRDSDALFEAT
jgi:hypothetical protein